MAASLAAVATTAASPLTVAVIGGSIGGLAAATAFTRLGARVQVFESSPTPFHGRGSSLGYVNQQLWEQLGGAKMIRRGVPANRSQGAYMWGDLWTFWAEKLPAGTIHYNSQVLDLGDDPLNKPTVNGVPYHLVVIADGGWSSLRRKYFTPREPEYAGWQVWRFRVPAEAVPGFQAYGALELPNIFLMCLDVALNNGTNLIAGGIGIPTPDESSITKPAWGENRQLGAVTGVQQPNPPLPAWFMPLIRKEFGPIANGEIVRLIETAARLGKITANPQFEFAADDVVNGRLVLVGDAAHLSVPRTASGAHTAVLDGYALLETFRPLMQEGATAGWDAVVKKGLAAYAGPGRDRAFDLYERSVEVSTPMLARGWVRAPVRARPREEL